MAAVSETRTTPYELLGGEPALRRLVDRFYEVMDQAPEARELRAMHGPDLAPMCERLFDFLSGWLGGPSRYLQRADAKCIVSAHAPFAIGSAESGQWVWCMEQAMRDTGCPQAACQLLLPALRRAADSFKNR